MKRPRSRREIELFDHFLYGKYYIREIQPLIVLVRLTQPVIRLTYRRIGSPANPDMGSGLDG